MSTNTNLSPSTTNFITRWKASGASERANYQLFLTEFCELMGVEKPKPATDKAHEANYTFEHPVEFDDGPLKEFLEVWQRVIDAYCNYTAQKPASNNWRVFMESD